MCASRSCGAICRGPRRSCGKARRICSACPAIVEAELLYGAENSNNPEEGRYFVESLLSPLHIIPFDSRCAACYARVRADLKRRGCIIGPNDLLIAATALAHGATLVSNNTRVFRRVEGLLLELWAEVDF